MTESPITALPYITRELQMLRVGAQVVQSAHYEVDPNYAADTLVHRLSYLRC